MKITGKQFGKRARHITLGSNNVLDDYRLEPLDMIIYGEIKALSIKTGYCFAHNDYLAKLRKKKQNDLSKSSLFNFNDFQYDPAF